MCLNSRKSLNDEILVEIKSIPKIQNEKIYNKYNDSKIYKIYSDDGHIYYGSTYTNIFTRLRKHIENSKKNSSTKLSLYFNTIGWDKAKIEVISEHNFNDKKQLFDEEKKYIKLAYHNPLSLNTNVPISTVEEIKNLKKIWSQSEKAKQKFICECGSSVCIGYKLGHFKSKKHLKYLETKTIL